MGLLTLCSGFYCYSALAVYIAYLVMWHKLWQQKIKPAGFFLKPCKIYRCSGAPNYFSFRLMLRIESGAEGSTNTCLACLGACVPRSNDRYQSVRHWMQHDRSLTLVSLSSVSSRNHVVSLLQPAERVKCACVPFELANREELDKCSLRRAMNKTL